MTGVPTYVVPTYPYYGGYGYYPGGVYTPYNSYYYPLVGGYPGYYSYPSGGYSLQGYPYGYGLPTPYGRTVYQGLGRANAVRRNGEKTTAQVKAPRAPDAVAPITAEQEQAVRHAEEVMTERPLREGKVAQIDPQRIRVRFSSGGASREDAIPTKDVFFFRKDGGMVTAASSTELLQTGDSVLFPDPLAYPRQVVAGQRQEARQTAASKNTGGTKPKTGRATKTKTHHR